MCSMTLALCGTILAGFGLAKPPKQPPGPQWDPPLPLMLDERSLRHCEGPSVSTYKIRVQLFESDGPHTRLLADSANHLVAGQTVFIMLDGPSPADKWEPGTRFGRRSRFIESEPERRETTATVQATLEEQPVDLPSSRFTELPEKSIDLELEIVLQKLMHIDDMLRNRAAVTVHRSRERLKPGESSIVILEKDDRGQPRALA